MSPTRLQQILTKFHAATSINLHTVKGFKIVEKHETPIADGFDFVVDNRQALEQVARQTLAEDLFHTDHYPPWNSTPSFGFTEVTQPNLKTGKWPEAVHVDFCLNPGGICGVHLDNDHRVVGRDSFDNAVFNYSGHPIVKSVIFEVALRRIPLANFKLRPIKVYDEPEPLGFDFESEDIAAIENIVRNLTVHRSMGFPTLPKLNPFDFNLKKKEDPTPYRHDSSDDVTGWIGNRVTLGEGYREKGTGTRVHIELSQDFKLGNVHLDTHAYLTPGGFMDPQQALLHGIYDLSPGFGFAGRTTNYTWQIVAGGSYTPKGANESLELGVPMEPGSGSGPIGGWTLSVGLVVRGRRPRRR